MVKIESNIPIPQPRNSYPFAEMKIGDSIALPRDEAPTLRSAALQWGMRNNAKFTSKLTSSTIRIWRIS